MRQLKKVITFIFLVLISIELAGCFYKPEIRVVSEVTAEEADAIQEEFAFILPEEAQIVQCRYANSKDSLFTVVITGVSDSDAFIENNVEFELEEPVEIDRFPYDEMDKTDFDKRVRAQYYFGMYDGSKRGIYIYSADQGIVIEIEKSGIVSPELIEMFGM
ncbi:MAG: hypothetical protein GX198_06060 [Epulopiscium sp.]|jgi:hypothetical protein|nr:hypothetical protein [Candidatus Epulonipiscium sp.]